MIDWTEATRILFTALVTTLFVGVLGFFFQKKIEISFQRSLFVYQTRYAKLHEKRAEVVAETYARLARVEKSFRYLLDPLPAQLTGESRDTRATATADVANEFMRYVDENRIFLDKDVCEMLIRFSKELYEIYKPFMIARMFPSNTYDINLHEGWSRGIDKLNTEIPILRKEIEDQFRAMLDESTNG